MPKTAGNVVTRKLGPLPAWAWLVSGLVVFWLYKRFAAGGTSAASASPTSIGTGTTTGVPAEGSGGGAAASGQGSAADNLTADLLAQQMGLIGQVNSNLVTGLLGAVGSVEGLGYGAYGLAAQSNQALVDATTRTYAAPTYVTAAPADGGGTGGTPTGGETYYRPAPTIGGTGALSATNIASGGGPFPPVASWTDWSGHAVSTQGTRVGGALAA